jgi:hypothetical protein
VVPAGFPDTGKIAGGKIVVVEGTQIVDIPLHLEEGPSLFAIGGVSNGIVENVGSCFLMTPELPTNIVKRIENGNDVSSSHQPKDNGWQSPGPTDKLREKSPSPFLLKKVDFLGRGFHYCLQSASIAL